jgi:hypothetical protein
MLGISQMTEPSSSGDAVGFSLTIPDSWFELDVRPSSRDARISLLVESRVRDQPELWDHRTELVRTLRRLARDAWDAGATYCACFVMVLEESVIPGSITVSVIPCSTLIRRPPATYCDFCALRAPRRASVA